MISELFGGGGEGERVGNTMTYLKKGINGIQNLTLKFYIKTVT